MRYRGHISRLTIKDVAFVGPGDCAVASGSDDGRMFIWDRFTGVCMRLIQPHSSCIPKQAHIARSASLNRRLAPHCLSPSLHAWSLEAGVFWTLLLAPPACLARVTELLLSNIASLNTLTIKWDRGYTQCCMPPHQAEVVCRAAADGAACGRRHCQLRGRPPA